MDKVCKLISSCTSCNIVPGCVWGIVYNAGGQCVHDLLELGNDVIGWVKYGESCENPFCKDILIQRTTNWGAMGGIASAAGVTGIIVGAVGIFLYFRKQKRPQPIPGPLPNPEGGMEPAAAGFARRQAVVDALEAFFDIEANVQDLELRREILRRFGADPEGGANELLEAIHQLDNQMEQIIVQAGPNPMLQNVAEIEEDHLGAAAVLQVDPVVEMNVGDDVLIELVDVGGQMPPEAEEAQPEDLEEEGNGEVRVQPHRAAKLASQQDLYKRSRFLE